MNIIVVLATDHPERDEWVDQQADQEASRVGGTPGPYQGIHVLPTGAPVHVYGPIDKVTSWLMVFPLQSGKEGSR